MRPNKSNRLMPLLMALCVVIGIVVGTFYANHFSGNRLNIINSGSNRINNLLHIIDDQYVDKVNIDSLVDMAIPQILSDLDPHSVYFSAKEMQQTTDDLKGSFSGVGIEFIIREDTIRIQGVVKNGPADQVGIRAGDKIVSVDGKPFVGKVVTNSEAMKRLKGPKDTKVKIGVIRYGEKKVKNYTITRGDIPQKSIVAAYMLDENTGYIKIKNFGENTYPEMLIALAKEGRAGGELTDLIKDLPEPAEAAEVRLRFTEKGKADFKTYGKDAIAGVTAAVKGLPGLSLAPDNYEGVRINFDAEHGKGWALVRMSLHEPIVPVNFESDEMGGCAAIARGLAKLLAPYEDTIDITPLRNFGAAVGK